MVAVDGSLGVPAEEPFAVEEVDVVVLLRQPPHHPVRGVDPLAVEFRGLLIEVACGVPVGLHEDQRFVGMGLDERRRDRVEALDAGADDYIVKPFFPRELVARIRAVLRRQGQEKARVERSDENVVRCGPLVMNEARFEASVDGVPVKLSGKEFRLLHLFASHPGRVFSRAQLLEAVWESVYVDERTVDVHMLRLRKALAGTAAEDLIETVRGVGYRCRGL